MLPEIKYYRYLLTDTVYNNILIYNIKTLSIGMNVIKIFEWFKTSNGYRTVGCQIIVLLFSWNYLFNQHFL